MSDLFVFTTVSKKDKEQHKELLDDVMAELRYLVNNVGYSQSVISCWKHAQYEPYSAPVYNDEEDRMEMKLWIRGSFPFKEYIKDCLK